MNELIKFPGYFINELGECFSPKGNKLTPQKNKKFVSYGLREYSNTISASKEMAKLYLNYDGKETVYYKDGNTLNCKLSNISVLGSIETHKHVISRLQEMYPNYDVKLIPGYSCYYAISNGDIYSIKKGLLHLCSQYLSNRGYLRVKFKDCKHVMVHSLIAKTFLDYNSDSGKVVHHVDCVKTNNSVDNLYVLTHVEHEKLHVFDKRSLTMDDANVIRKLYLDGKSQIELSKLFNVSDGVIHKIINNQRYNEL